jgi:hypothetical protein
MCIRLNIILLIAAGLFFTSCKKNKRDQIFNIVYAVDVYASDTMSLEYHSDYYHSSGELKRLNPLDTLEHNLYLSNTLWLGTRNTENEEEGYYISVDFEDVNVPAGAQYGIRVFVNDTILIDSKYGDANGGVLVLEGVIPEDFK